VRTFVVFREGSNEETGRIVAEGVEFSDGFTVLHWRADERHPAFATSTSPSLAELLRTGIVGDHDKIVHTGTPRT